MITDDQVKSAYSYAYAMQKIHRFNDEDIVQEGMLRFVEIMTDDDTNFKRALVGLRNRVKDCLRKKRRLNKTFTSIEESKEAAEIIIDIGVLEDQVLFEQVYNLILGSANQLEKQVIDAYLEGYNFVEISSILKIKPEHARQCFSRTIQKMRERV